MCAALKSLWPDYRTVWRWHFFAGLFCLPFVVLLCVTGSIYLFKPQIDDWIDWRYDHLAPISQPATARHEVQAALAAMPGSKFLAYEMPRGPTSAARVIVDHHGDAVRLYVDPGTLKILKRVSEDNRFERLVFRLHGQLLIGNPGSVIMEMVASWTIVLIVTGLYLWWPRGARGAGGVVYPRVATRGRTRWRDLHAVCGLWVSCFLVLFLASGLPWSFIWGHTLSEVETVVGRVTSVKDWEIGAVPARSVVAGRMVAMPGMDMGQTGMADADGLDGLDAVVATAARLRYPAPVLITPPASGGRTWRVRSDTQDRPLRISAQVDRDGMVQSVDNFAAKGVIDRAIGYGVAAHEGHLFGWANQVLNLLVATGLTIMSIAAIIMWVRRKPPGQFGAPPKTLPSGRIGAGAIAVMIVLGVVLPELGASLVFLVLATTIGRKFAR